MHKRNGVIYLDVHKLPERPKSELERRRYCFISSYFQNNTDVRFFVKRKLEG